MFIKFEVKTLLTDLNLIPLCFLLTELKDSRLDHIMCMYLNAPSDDDR